jgi:hypothetical protein
MAKLTFEQATEAVVAAKAVRSASRKAVDDFVAANGLKTKKDHSEDPKHGKAFSKLHKQWKKDKEAHEEAEKAAKALKPQVERASKYEYPADVVTADDKKKFRAKMRTAAKNDGKPAKEAKPAKEKKAEKTEAAPEKKKKAKVETVEAEAEAPVKKKKKKVTTED